jgi:hypothetical protein
VVFLKEKKTREKLRRKGRNWEHMVGKAARREGEILNRVVRKVAEVVTFEPRMKGSEDITRD